MPSRLERRYARMPDEELLVRSGKLDTFSERERVTILEELSARRLFLKTTAETEEDFPEVNNKEIPTVSAPPEPEPEPSPATYAEFQQYFAALPDQELFAQRVLRDDFTKEGRVAFNTEMERRRIVKFKEARKKHFQDKLQASRSPQQKSKQGGKQRGSNNLVIIVIALLWIVPLLMMGGDFLLIGIVSFFLLRILAEAMTK